MHSKEFKAIKGNIFANFHKIFGFFKTSMELKRTGVKIPQNLGKFHLIWIIVRDKRQKRLETGLKNYE